MVMKRLFVAIKIEPDKEFLVLFRELKSLLLHERIKWVEEKNLHITLKFLGETPEQSIPGIDSLLSSYASVVAPFSYRLTGTGVFGSRYAPRVVWAGIEPFGEITSIMAKLQVDFEKIGYEKDRQNHIPHLTLGRINSLSDRVVFQRAIEKFRVFSGPEHVVNTMILFESILRPGGPEYRVINKYNFTRNVSS